MPYVVQISILKTKVKRKDQPEKVSPVEKVKANLEKKGLMVQKLKAESSYLLIVRVHDGDLTNIMSFLSDLGVGTHFGIINVYHVAATVPSIVPLDDGEKKDHAAQRLPVEVIYNQIAGGSELSFDYIMNIIVAAVIAAAGLATNNSVTVVASMLVSPLMGPILAFTFASLLKDSQLAAKGIAAEIAGIVTCWLCGCVFGLGFAYFGPFFEWPSAQMADRGTPDGLLVGVVIAVPSGIGVALAVTVSNINSLVGVAISAALLPPIVNSGMCFVYAFIGPLIDEHVQQHVYLTISGYSALLFMVNLVCIYLTALATLKVKQIAPVATRSLRWKDLPSASDRHAARNSMHSHNRIRLTGDVAVQRLFAAHSPTKDQQLDSVLTE
eukprot:TRINITY_DN12208_c0_g1_i1.p1 TRINITY_DN12208_c0_g1~~TRINITY_DN12208_c0_g1_i1.p1  ORF type:complete len:382 (+),score=66.28 TRINITY_DN12208_c0_g1_i1:160-1305(+)